MHAATGLLIRYVHQKSIKVQKGVYQFFDIALFELSFTPKHSEGERLLKRSSRPRSSNAPISSHVQDLARNLLVPVAKQEP